MAKQKQEQVNQTQPPLAISAKELAAILGVSLRHVCRLDEKKMLPKALWLGGSRKWLRKEIEAFLEAGAPDREVWEAIKDGGNYDSCK
ncbi:MAG: helix-turn-helix domain-containing protein [Planctomycetes bacterium]|nr:helix-turn-helix domain-containing protein [Planctomycetota bacterium]